MRLERECYITVIIKCFLVAEFPSAPVTRPSAQTDRRSWDGLGLPKAAPPPFLVLKMGEARWGSGFNAKSKDHGF